MRRALPGLIAVFLAGCAGTTDRTPDGDIELPPSPLALSVSREVDPEGHLYARVQIRNASDHPVCIATDVLERETTFAMHIALRRRSHAPIAFRSPGYVPPPLPGVSTLEPGAEVSRRYPLSNRFAPTEGALVGYRDLEILARFSAGGCPGVFQYPIDSGWRPFD